MSDTPYARIDLERLESGTTPEREGPADAASKSFSRGSRDSSWLRWGLVIMPLAVALSVAQAATVILAETTANVYMSSTLVPVIGFAVMLLFVLAINPITRLLLGRWLKPLSRVELITLFASILVSSGICSFGLTAQLIPIISTPWNPNWNVPSRGWDTELLPYLNEKLYITDPEQVRLYQEGLGAIVVKPAESAPWGKRLRYYRQVIQAIPWGVWARPIGYWMILIIGCYGVFFFLSYVVLDYWSRREKLIFPLAQLPQSLLPEDDTQRWWPATFCSPVFWLGFSVATVILGWNACVAAKWMTGLSQIPLGMDSGSVRHLAEGTPFAGISYVVGSGRLQFTLGFFAVGIAFLLPLEISSSVWFYFLMGQLIYVIGGAMGYTEFPTDWLWYNNPVSGLGAGGLLLFSALSLWRSIRVCIHLGSGKGLGQRIRLALPVVGLLASIMLVTLWLMWNNLSFFWALLFVGVTTLVTVGIMRIVAEGGIYWMQTHVSFFHVYKMLGLAKFLKPALLGPMLPIYSILFLDIKTFIAPNLLNAAKMQQDTGGSRVRFHLTIITTIIVSIVISLTLVILLCYERGAQQMQDWFFSAGPQLIMDTARTAIRTEHQFDAAMTTWYVLGAIWVALTMFARQFLFWFPHPIGFIMQVNPLMGPVWFSFFIAWVCKKLVIKYGGKASYDKVRLFFIGLIVAELLAVFLWPVMGMLFGFEVGGIDLNRN